MQLLIVRNPGPDSRLPYLLRAGGAGAGALLCPPRRGDRPGIGPRPGTAFVTGVHHRPGRRGGVLAVRPDPQTGPARGTDPTARAAGIADLEIGVDAHEQYPYRFANQQARTIRRALPCGDYGLIVDGRLVASVERKSLADLVASLTGGKLRYALADLAALPRAAVVVEDRYYQVFTLDRVRPAVVADALAVVQVRFPTVPVVFTDTRALAEEWTYRYLAAAHAWTADEHTAGERIGLPLTDLDRAPAAPGPSTAEIRA